MSSGHRLNRVFILGSCVSRDAFRVPDHGFELAGYIARTSLASAFIATPAPPSMIEAADAIESKFQRRMVQMDLGKRAAATLRKGGFDFLLLDLIDERFNLARFGGSDRIPALVTLSKEFSRVCGWGGPILVPGSPQYMAAWRRGVGQLLKIVPPARILVNRAFWARELEDGTPLPDQALIEANNSLLAYMYDFLRRCGVCAGIDYPDGFAAAADHCWGIAPFHYVERVYRRQLAEMARMAQTLDASSAPLDADAAAHACK
jgi:hypothetical protein